MDVFQAAYRLAHDYPGGAVKLAGRLGINPGTFLNRLNPEQDTHKLSLGEAVLMQAVTGDHRILWAMAGTLGEVCFPVPDLSKVSDAALLELLCRIGAEGGDFHRAILHGLESRTFTKPLFTQVEQEGLEFIAAIAEMIARMKGLVDE